MKRIVLASLLAVSLSAAAEPLQVIEAERQAVCAVRGTQIVGPCAFLAALLQKMRAHCAGMLSGGGCGSGCAGETCQVRL